MQGVSFWNGGTKYLLRALEQQPTAGDGAEPSARSAGYSEAEAQ